jgi:dethiobiotin synthetase
MTPILYVTGTNTGVGKTTLCRLLLQRARERNIRAAAMKPFCTGGRDDAEQLHALQTAGLALDEVNPFLFTEPVTPYIAAQSEDRAISFNDTIASIKKVRSTGHPLLIEGAGGLLSPLGNRFTLLEIITDLPGKVCVVGQNTLGVINAALLTHRALLTHHDTRFVLMNPLQRDASAKTNAKVISAWTSATVVELPFLDKIEPTNLSQSAIEALDNLLDWWIR